MTRASSPSPRARARFRRGFTLIELLVALTGGLFVSVAVFALARDASRFYQREGRVANATLAGLAGFERLRADLARAGFLSTPNIQADPAVCTRPGAANVLANLASVLIADKGSVGETPNPALAANDLEPDSVLLTGSYSSADEFPIRTAVPAENGTTVVYLQTQTGPMARLGFTTASEVDEKRRLLADVFAAGRVLRIVDNEGRQHYGVIAAANVGADGNDPTITLSSAAPIQFRANSAQLCGLKGLETGATVNVVNFIRYEIKSLAGNTGYAALYSGSNYAPDANRTELVRTELTADGTVMLEELVAEYAVDLQLDVTAVKGATGEPSPAFVSAADTDFASVTSPPSDAGARPQDIRAIRARLLVRSREADRDTDIVTAKTNGGLFRIGLGPEGGPPFARVRTLQADIMLNNHAGLRW